MTSRLFQPLKLGSAELQNRVALAPLTRLRADNHVPLPFVKEYYAQRATEPGTLLISEGAYISPQGAGMLNAPGLWTQEQLAAWKEVTDAVHAKGSVIYAQLWAMGRAVDSKVAAHHGVDVVSASDLQLKGYAVPRPLTEPEIYRLINEFAQAAHNAVHVAGFDGVEIHGANGYLVDQFLQDVTNRRTDRWGGSIENRARFPLEVVRAVAAAVGPERTAIRLSPWGEFQDMRMADPRPQFTYLVAELKKIRPAYLHLVEPRVSGSVDKAEAPPAADSNDFILDHWDNQSPILLAGGFNLSNPFETLDKRYPDKDIIAVYGRHFISTPDIVFRLRKQIPFTPYDRATFYKAKSEDGYTDYAFSDEYKKEFASRL